MCLDMSRPVGKASHLTLAYESGVEDLVHDPESATVALLSLDQLCTNKTCNLSIFEVICWEWILSMFYEGAVINVIYFKLYNKFYISKELF